MPDEIRDEREYTREEMREACRTNYNAALASAAQSVEKLRALIREVIAAKRMPHEWVERAEDVLNGTNLLAVAPPHPL